MKAAIWFVLGLYFTSLVAYAARTSRFDEFQGGTFTGDSATITTITGTTVNGGNLRISGNSLISTDTNGNITLNPDGTGLTIFNDLTATTVPYLGSSKELLSSAVTPTELGYLSGVTSAIQTQLNAKTANFSGTTDNVVMRSDGTGGATIQESGVSIDDSDAVTGVTSLTVDNLVVNGNDISSSSGDITLTPTSEVDISGNTNILTQGDLRLQDTTGGEYIGFQAPSTVTSSVTFTLPDGDGSSGQLLSTNGSAVLAWSSPGAVSFSTVTKSSSTTLATTGEDNVVCDTSGGAVTLTLPAVSGNSGLTYKIVNEDDANACTIDGNSAETINGRTTYVLTGIKQSVIIFTDGVEWFTASSSDHKTKSCFISNSGTPAISDTDSCNSWVSSITDNGVGDATINIVSGVFNTKPICVANNDLSNLDRVCKASSSTTSSVRVYCGDSNNPPAAEDRNFSIICIGGY